MQATTVGKPNPVRTSFARGLVLVAAAGAALIGARLGAAPLLDPDEARHALAALEMVERGAWIEPTLDFEPYHHKLSPLYVLVGLGYRVLGTGELAARVVPAVSAWLTLVLVYCFASRRGARRGLLAALLLAACALFVLVGRFTSFDATFTLLVSGAAFAFAAWLDEGTVGGRRWLLYSAYAAGALAVLVKGPAAAALLAVPALLVLARSDRRLVDAEPVRGTLLVGAIVACWAVPAWLVEPGYLVEFVVVHNVQRFLGGSSVFHPEPMWFFVPILAGAMLPWSLHVPAAVAAGFRSLAPGTRYLAIYALWVVIFFSLSRGKLATYILPAVPAFAVLTAWSAPFDRGGGRGDVLLRMSAALSVIVAPAALAVVAVFARDELPVTALFLPASLAGLIVLLRPRSIRSTAIGLAALSIGFVSSIVAVNLLAPRALGRYTSDHDLAVVAARLEGVERRLSYRVQPYSFLFYSRGPLEILYGEHSAVELGDLKGAVMLTKTKRLEGLDFAEAGWEAQTVAENARHVLVRFVPSTDAGAPR